MPKVRDTKWATGKKNVGENHWFYVENGKYYFDCGGFVRYMLNDTFSPGWRSDNRSPRGMHPQLMHLPFLAIRADQKRHPNHWSGDPEDWINFAEKLKKGVTDPVWELVSAPGYDRGNVDNIKRGDIVAREKDPLKPPPEQHGHMMIAMGEPKNGRLKIADSTSYPKHTNDTRDAKGWKGMGTGEIKVKGNKMAWSVDKHGDPRLRIWVVRHK